jgi:PAS domain S-box-containing protein
MPIPPPQRYNYPLGSGDSRPEKTVIRLVLDAGGRFVRWNRAAEAATGYAESEMVGHPLWEALAFQEDSEWVANEFRRIASGTLSGSLEFRWKLCGGAARWMACGDFRRRISPGGMECLAIAATDVTESRHSRGSRAPLSAQFIEARDTERREISRFIHDTAAQNLVSLAFSLEQWCLDPAARDMALELVGRCCRDVRLLAYIIAPPDLGDEGGLAEGIEWHARTLRESGALDIDFHADLASENLSAEARALIFSAVHEFTARAIVNRGKKALAIVLKREGPAALLEVKGAFGSRGADRDYPAIRERVGALGGRFETTPDTVRIVLPIALSAGSP